MPYYRYVCPSHGEFEKRAGYDDKSVQCVCGQDSLRQPIYRLNVVIQGQSMPRRDDVETVQEEYGKEVRKRGWTAERAVEEIRASRFTDASDHPRIDTRKMTQTA